MTLALRQSKLGPNGQVFRGARVEHSDHLALGERLTVQYGVEYVLAGLGRSTSTLRPRVELEARVSPNWRTSLLIAAQPVFNDDPNATALDSALAALDAFPAVLLRNGRPVLESGWHEELSVERRLSPRVSFVVAGFHDRAGHQAVAGRGSTADPDILQDFYSAGFLYDGGSAGSWGARMAYRQKVSEDLEIAAVYSWAGGIVLAEDPFARPTTLREAFENGYRHSVGARVAGRVPRLGTQVAASYKWVNGPVLTRVDRFGESLYQLDPNFNLCVRQPLPSFNGTRIEALADFNNLLAQGYVPVRMADGRVLLAPSFRSFRGGVSFQF